MHPFVSRRPSRARRLVLAGISGLLVLGGAFAIVSNSGAASATVTVFATNAKPAVPSAADPRSVELGMRFWPKRDLYATGVRFYKGAANRGTHTGTLWTAGGQPLRHVMFTHETAGGWQHAKFAHPLLLRANARYVVSYHAPRGHYSYTYGYFAHTVSNSVVTMPAAGASGKPNGVFRYGGVGFPTAGSGRATNYWVDVTLSSSPTTPTTTKPTPTTNRPTPTTRQPTPTTKSPTPTTKPPVPGAFPSTANTGVPKGTRLTNYTGPMTIRSCGVVIDSKIINGDLTILAGNGTRSYATPCVTIRKSLIKGTVDDKWADFVCGTKVGCGPVVMIDNEVAIPRAADVAAVSDSNIFMWRNYVHGARSGVQCDGFCEIRQSYLVADHEYRSAHMDAFISNGNYGHKMVLFHNSFLCQPVNGPVPNGAGCAADVGLFGDFSAISNMTVTNNLFKATHAAGYCAYTGAGLSGKPYPNGTNLVWKDNVFQRGDNGKCGFGGAVRDWKANSGNVWCNNTWDNRVAVLSGVVCKP
jgi:hypothetical protein